MEKSRREFFEIVGAGTAALGLAPATALAAPKASAHKEEDGPIVQVGENIAVVETTGGKVRGYVMRGINTFLGIPYGADTSGANRFLPPQPAKPWTNVFPALWWGESAPQIPGKRQAMTYAAFRDRWNYDDFGEDCLRINVYSPALNDGRKRPVLFWIHGGGFTAGNGIEQPGYDGENLARFGDVVFCSINHRLGPLGFANFAGVGGEAFAASGNVGMLDIVFALKWVRDNIASFGGDPGNVTIMGQSGGGAKVCLLTAMPSASGLFHKAVVLSGASTRSGDKEYAERLGAAVLKEAGLAPSEMAKLQAMPWRDYYAVATRAQQKLAAEMAGVPSSPLRRGFGPSVDGTILPAHPYYPDAAPTAASVPMIICSTFHEQSMSWADPTLETITLAEVTEKLRQRAGFGPGLGDAAPAVVDAYSKAFPGRKPVEIWSLASSNRQSVVALADAKSKQPAPVHVAWFGWQPPLFDGHLRAFHCIDICFWFYNTDVMWSHTGGGARPRKLSAQMASRLVNFMKTGKPDAPGAVTWPRYSAANGEVLVLDDVSEAKNDPDREARKALPSLT